MLRERVERLACDFPIHENYFAWQAFGRGYDIEHRAAVPAYLQRETYDLIRTRTDKVEVHHASLTDFLAAQPAHSMHRYVLLDAQDWMNSEQITALWREIDRTADTRDARVIFRTAGPDSPLPRKLPADVLAPWMYLEEREQGLARPGPLLHLWRLSRLCPPAAVLTVAAGDSHAALMDRIYRRQRYIYDFTRKYYLFGRDRLIRQLDLKPGARVIEVGCGTARNLIKIAKSIPGREAFTASMPRRKCSRPPSASLAQAGLDGAGQAGPGLCRGAVARLFGETEPFDAVVFSYSLSMIPDWKQALRVGTRRARAGREASRRGFRRPAGAGQAGRTVLLRAWLGLFHVAPREELLTNAGGKAWERAAVWFCCLAVMPLFCRAAPPTMENAVLTGLLQWGHRPSVNPSHSAENCPCPWTWHR